MTNHVIELPHPPSVNHYYLKSVFKDKKSGKHRVSVRISEAGQEFRLGVRSALNRSKLPRLLEGRLKVVCLYNPPDRRVRDVANYEKATMDAMTQAGFWLDDKQIDDFRIVRGKVIKGGSIVVHYLETTVTGIQCELMLSEPAPF